MICRVCGNEVNLTITGLPDDLCWGCASKDDKDDVLNTAIDKRSEGCSRCGLDGSRSEKCYTTNKSMTNESVVVK